MGQKVQMKKETLREVDMVLSILWEGDLEIHTNHELMRNSAFGERIVHGDVVIAKCVGPFLKNLISNGKIQLEHISYSFFHPVYIGETVESIFHFKHKEMDNHHCLLAVDFQVTNNSGTTVSAGDITLKVWKARCS